MQRSLGGGVQLTGIWKRAFVDLGISRHSIDGERVFVDGDREFRVGIPLEAMMFPVDIAGGWRFASFARLLPYAGVGVTYLRYRETSSFAGSTEHLDQGAIGPLLIGGVDVHLWRRLSAGADLRWRRVTGILGTQGVSTEFGEEDAGGLSLGLKFTVGF